MPPAGSLTPATSPAKLLENRYQSKLDVAGAPRHFDVRWAESVFSLISVIEGGTKGTHRPRPRRDLRACPGRRRPGVLRQQNGLENPARVFRPARLCSITCRRAAIDPRGSAY